MPLVSVVIPFYSGVDWLCEAVDSVLNQTMTDYEILVINDGSPEDVTSFLDAYGDKVTYHYKENGGPATARNMGIDVATGKYVAFLDSDDRWLENHLQVQIDAMEQSGAMWSYCGYRTFGVGDSVSYSMTKSDKPEYHGSTCPYIATPCVVVRREVFANHSDCRFNPAMRYGQDAYCWMMINSYYPILALPECLTEVRMRGGNASKRARVQLKARSDMWKCRKANKERLIDGFNISLMHKVASELCVFGDNIVTKAEKKLSPASAERLSKVLFVLPWSITKLNRIRKKLFIGRPKQK